MINCRNIDVVPFDEAALLEYQALPKAYPRLDKMDLKVAAIAISQSTILLTRNQKDFGRITVLDSQDWAV